MGALNFYMADIYGSGYQSTRTQVIPEEDDQMALVDDQELAKDNPVNTDPNQGKYIMTGIAIIAIIIVAFSIVG